jgi:tetratricopeptide (TPR) repeat protein
MRLSAAFILVLAGAMASVTGCNNPSAGESRACLYRTVTAEPGRDTEAARRDNQAGLDLLAKGDLDAAADAFQRALTADIEFGPAHNNLGKVYYLQKDWYKAAWEFEFASKQLPNHAEPRNNLGLVLEEAGQLDRAVASYREAIAFDPDNIQYRANLARALVRRGDRTDEVRALLDRLIEQETRGEWRAWAVRERLRLTAPGKNG